LKREADRILAPLDFILTPTAPSIYRRDEEAAAPIELNSRLGYYTNFMNLLDYSAIAVPAGFCPRGLPRGVTLFAGAFQDHALLDYAEQLETALGLPLGATSARRSRPLPASDPTALRLAACGAHMSGLPLNHELTSRGARFVGATRTAAQYRLYALAGGPPRRPGLVQVSAGGAGVEVELWDLPLSEVGGFLAGVPAPLGIGTLQLADGTRVKGFLCEAAACGDAEDITAYGSWRGFLRGPAAA